ncbi:uncharacterized protein [Cherax quadricarinatus]|nr:uncharacterized protein LOC128690798 isoform X1 [Cherax quadricarinatus]
MDGSVEDAILASLAELASEGSRGCCIRGCRNSTYRTDAVYFTLPEDPHRCAVWLKILSKFVSETDEKSKIWICSDHFCSRDISLINSQPELTPSAIPNIQVYAKSGFESKDSRLSWGDDQLSFTSQAASLPKMNVETQNAPKPLEDCVQLLPESSKDHFSSDVKRENMITIKEEPLPEVKATYNTFGDSQVTCETKEVVFKRKRGRPRKGASVPQTMKPQTITINDSQKSSSGPHVGKSTCNTITKSLAYDSTEDPGDAETDTESKSKRKRRSKVLNDYVSDFNTSDEEDVNLINDFSKFTHQGRGRGRGRKSEPSETYDDLFSNYVGVFGKKFSLPVNEDFLDDDILEEVNDIEGSIYSSSIFNKSSSINESKPIHEFEDKVEVMLGPGGRTKIQIVYTGKNSIVNDEESLIYHVITTTGKTTSVTPLTIPKLTNDAECESDNINYPSTSQAKCEASDEGKADTDLEVDGSKPRLSSRGRRIKSKHMMRTYNQQVASLQQKYYRALQEIRKRPRVYTLADLVYGASRFLTEDQLIFFTLQLKSSCNNTQGIRLSVREKILALAFYLQSPALYKWLRAIFHLPSKLILERWLEGIAKRDPEAVKKIMYHIYTQYVFRS